ncbi:MAG TPA: cell division protein ZapA [Chitinophagaceae bacterium]|nr:cell division protein ZapA [Chitinophagaceae bacterium]
MSELIPINVLIGDRSYRIKLAPQDEEQVRKTLRIINEKILEFRTQFAGKDMQDYISMVVLWYATQLKTGGQEEILQSEITEELARLESQIDQALPPEK